MSSFLGLFSRDDPSEVIHSRESSPPVHYEQRVMRGPAQPEIPCRHTCACVPYWAIKNDQIPTLQAWLINDGPKVGGSVLHDLLKTCVLRCKEAMAQLILKVDVSPPLDASFILAGCIQNMRRPQVVTALTLGAKFTEICPKDIIHVFCAENGDVAKLLLDKGLNPDMFIIEHGTNDRLTLLWAACTRSDTVVLEALIKAGADTSLLGRRTDLSRVEIGFPYYKTPLSAAALISPNLSCLEFLLHNKYVKPDVNGVDRWLLHYLILPKKIPSAWPWLTRKGANRSPLVESGSDEPSRKSREPNHPSNCLEMLLNHGLNPNSLCVSDCDQSRPILTFAAGNGNSMAVKLLLEKGALIDIGHFDTALMHALQCADLGPLSYLRVNELSLRAAISLVHAGADVAPGNETAATAIHLAINMSSSDVLNRLFEAMRQGRRPPKYKHMDTPQYIKWMINRGYMETATALIQALKCGTPDLVQLLLDNGADVHQSDRLGRTALIRALECGEPNLVQLLLDKRADVHQSDRLGRSSLMVAAWQLRQHAGPQPETEKSHKARSKAETICMELIWHGADPHKSDGANHNAYYYAGDEAYRFAELVEEVRLRREAAEVRRKVAEVRREAAGDDGTGVDGKSSAQTEAAIVEDDMQLDVEKAQETVVEGGSSSSRPQKRGRSREVVHSTAKRRRVD